MTKIHIAYKGQLPIEFPDLSPAFFGSNPTPDQVRHRLSGLASLMRPGVEFMIDKRQVTNVIMDIIEENLGLSPATDRKIELMKAEGKIS